jgi:hypothetical protein
MSDPIQGDLRVWWLPQIPSSNPFIRPVNNLEQAMLLLNCLANYDLYQLENNIKPDYSNAGGLEVYEDGQWCEWEDEFGDNIDDLMREGKAK